VSAGVEDTHGLLKSCPLDEDADVLNAVFDASYISVDTDYSKKLVLEVLHFALDSLRARVKEDTTVVKM
jgi:hypothetical protein